MSRGQDGNALRGLLRRIDGRGYSAYKELAGGAFELDAVTLHVDRVQGDPFAAPSLVRLRMPASATRIPDELFSTAQRRIALQDWLARRVHAALGRRQSRGSGKSGVISIDVGGQQVLERTALVVTPRWVEARMEVGLPARGRRVLGRQAEEMLCEELPEVARHALVWNQRDGVDAKHFVDEIDNQEHLRAQLRERGLIAFVGDGAILPRSSGVSDGPMERKRAVPFRSPESLSVTLPLRHVPPGARDTVRGMGIPRGVTLVVGGGYHGKSTLLQALQRGVYAHIPGDGRERVVTDPDVVKIRAEDGRRVENVDISPFIDALPGGRSTTSFRSEDASGSTSQAANILEAAEVGATGLLLDEDTCATNFMVRDARMQALVAKEHEPITPFLDRVRELWDGAGISTVLVMGGCGDYLDVADKVIMMREYVPHDITDEAREVAVRHGTQRQREARQEMGGLTLRIPRGASFDPSRGNRAVKIQARDVDELAFGEENLDLRALEQLVDRSQTRAVGYAIHLAASRFMKPEATLREVVDSVDALFDERGLDVLDPSQRGDRHPGNFARPRRHEIAAAMNRLRTAGFGQHKKS